MNIRSVKILFTLLLLGLPMKGRAKEPVSFELDVQPILTSAGCNAGACHGKQRGQNGFQLSLLGFDSDFDFQAIVMQARGRRVIHAAPESSLLLQKATATTPHGGGRKIEPESDEYQVLANWIEQGTVRRITSEPALVDVRLDLTELSLLAGARQGLRTTAMYSDGSTRDVTKQTTFLSNETTVASVTAAGEVVAGKLPGETSILARYMNHIKVCNVVIPRQHSPSDQVYQELPKANFIDELVWGKLQKLGIRPSQTVDDATFMRRAYTDIIGRLPTTDEARRFLNSVDLAKRRLLVDELLDRPEYADHWANQWADLLRPNPYRVGIKAVLNYDNWIRQQFRENVPYDEFVSKIVTAKGSTWKNGPSTLYRDRRSADETTTLISQIFLGVRLECAKCHHHPFERWSQDDFYQFAAYFANVDRKGTGLSPPISGGEETVFISRSGEVRHPVTNQVMTARPLFGSSASLAKVDDAPIGAGDPREDLAAWMRSAGGDLLAQTQANRVWATMMGRGIVEPVDDFRSTNPPTNAELITALGNHFRASGFNMRELIRLIADSTVYSLSSIPNDSNVADRLNFSRHYRHRLRAEVLADSLQEITGIPFAYDGMPAGARASQVWTYRSDSIFLDTFGRPNENQDPPCERTPEATVTQALHLMNGVEIDRQIRNDQGKAAKLSASSLSTDKIVEDLYLAIYSRMPSSAELGVACRLLQANGRERLRQSIEDLMWAMINSPEFSIQN